MNKFLRCALLLSTLLLASGCRHDADSPAPSDELAGSWLLTALECFCAYDPKVVEVLTLSRDQQFRLTRDGRLAAQGTYALTQGVACAGDPLEPYLQLTTTTGGAGPSGVYAVRDNTLTIRQCVALYAPGYTYQRQ